MAKLRFASRRFDHRVWMAPLPKRGRNQGHKSDRKDKTMKRLSNQSSVWPRSENTFQARKAEGHKKNPEPSNAKFAAFPGGFDFTRELRRVGDEPGSSGSETQSRWECDKRDPPPDPVIGDPSAERRADHRGSHDGHAVWSKRLPAALRRECVTRMACSTGPSPPPPDTLQNAKENEQRPVRERSHTAENSTSRGRHKDVVAFAPENAAQPRRKRKHYSIRHQIARQHPGALVIADAEAAGNVG